MKETRRTRVYIAGPMTSSGNPYINIYNGLQTSAILLDRGYAPYTPHLSSYQESAIGGRPVDVWLGLDHAFLITCDALLRLPGESKGADQEIVWAIENNVKVYLSLDTLFSCERPERKLDGSPNVGPNEWLCPDCGEVVNTETMQKYGSFPARCHRSKP